MSIQLRNLVQKGARQRPNPRQPSIRALAAPLTNVAALAIAAWLGFGAVAARANLPVVLSQPANLTVNSGATANLTVSVSPVSAPVTYDWWNEFGPLYPPQTNATLSLKNVETFDAGRYSVVVKNTSGAVTSAVAVLAVNPPASATGDNFLFGARSGGPGLDLGGNLTVDAAGNTYLVGGFAATVSIGSTTLRSSGGTDMFVAKYNRAGAVLWARKAGGAGEDLASGVAVDRSGNIHVTGSFSSSAAFSDQTLTSAGERDVFVATYDRGGTLLWVRKAGGPLRDTASRIAADAAGNSYLIGTFSGAASFGSATLVSSGGDDVFVAKFSSSGFVIWAKRIGGAGQDFGDSIALDSAGNALVAGRFTGTIPFGSGSLTAGSSGSAFLAYLDRAGTVTWARQASGIRTNHPPACAMDVDGNGYLAGSFFNTAQFGSLSVTSRMSTDLFLARYNNAGTVQWVGRAGGEPGRRASIGIASSNAGITAGFVTGSAVFAPNGGSGDLFVAKRNEAGTFLWAKQAGTSYADFPLGLTVDASGARYLTGFFDARSADTNLTDFSMLLAPLAEGVSPKPPLIATEPQSQTILVGSNASFGVTVSAAGSVTYQWQFNGTNISGATSPQYLIPDVQRAHAGRYSVIVTSTDGIAVSRDAILAVYGAILDGVAPTVAISEPPAHSRLTDAVLTIRGTAKDNQAVARVEVQLGEGPVQTASGTTSWAASLPLQPGLNQVQVRSIDAAGNASKTVERSFIYVLNSSLTVSVSGGGTFSPDLNGRSLEIGKSYTITATPNPGHVFSNWTGSLNSGIARLSFTMVSNLVLQANFVANPFYPMAGLYHGLFYESDDVRHESSGALSLKLTAEGKFTGSLQGNGKRLSLAGQFHADGRATNLVRWDNTRSWAVELSLDFVRGDRLTGRVSDGIWSADLLSERAAPALDPQLARLAGKYTVVLPGQGSGASSPGGDGFGTITISAGKLSLAASLGDGTKGTQRLPLPASGYWPFYLPLYSGKGSALGWIAFTNRASDDLNGLVSWINSGSAKAKMYKAGFTNETRLVGSAYTAPITRTNRVLNFTTGILAFTGGSLSAPLTNRVFLDPDNRVLNLDRNRLNVTLAAASGLFRGSIADPVTGKSLPVKGVVLQKRDLGSGHFMGTDRTGKVSLVPSAH